jgi:hypothetical protein
MNRTNEQSRIRAARERAVIAEAQKQDRCVTYIDDDGCEITVTPSGHTFYNAADWW